MNKLSIVIITLNESRYIDGLLSDLSRQYGKELIGDVIVCDGGSTDNTLEIARSYTSVLPIVTHIADKRGYGYQKNAGAGRADSEFMMFMDADIRIGPQTIRVFFETLQANPDKISVSYIAADSTRWLYRLGALLVDTYFRVLTVFGKQTASGQCIALSRRSFDRIGGFDAKLIHGEDLDLLRRAQKQGIKMIRVKHSIIKASVRRFESVGTVRLLSRYARSELHRLTHRGKIEKDYIGYDKT